MKKICFLVDSIFSIGGVQRVTAVIAKELAKRHYVTIVTFDSQNMSLYGLEEADIRYRFFHYPPVGYWKNMMCKAYSMLYRKVIPQTRLTSGVYAHSSYEAIYDKHSLYNW